MAIQRWLAVGFLTTTTTTVGALVMTLLISGCSNGAPGSADGLDTVMGGNGTSSSSQDTCATPNDNCPCPTAGEVVRCGRVERTTADAVWCSQGFRQCVGDRWGTCVGDSITTKAIAPTFSLHTDALGLAQACQAANACDPYCYMSQDDGSGGLDAGPGFTATPEGITLTSVLPPALATCNGLTVTPTIQSVTVTSLNPIVTDPPSVAFTAALVPTGCYSGAFQVSWDVDKFDRALMTSGSSSSTLKLLEPFAGPINITPYVGNLSASANVNVVVNATETAAAPAGTSGSFAGAGTSADNDLTILYPYNATVYPVAIGAPRVMWSNNGVNASAVRVSLRYPTTGAPLFQWSAIVDEGSPPGYQIPQYAWAALDEVARGSDVALSVQRLVGLTLKFAKTVTMKFSPLGLRGKIIYTDYSNTADVRTFKPGDRFATNTSAYPAGAGSGCNNPCHTVSSNGKRIVTSNWYEPWGVSTINPDGSTTAISASPNSSYGTDSRGFAYSAVTGDGMFAVQTANWWGNTLDYAVGGDNGNHASSSPIQLWQLSDIPGTAPLEVTNSDSWGLGTDAIMVPSFSPNGKKLLGVDGDRTHGASWRQGIHTWDFNTATKRFSNPSPSFAQTNATNEYIRWPSFESDSRSVMFQTNPTSADDSSYGGMLPSGFHTIAGKLYSVDSQVANAPVALDTLNAGLGGSDSNQNYQPTMLPVSVGGYRWSVFTTSRLYGNVLNNSGTLTTQLWVSAIDDQISGTSDRSHPPFWLPGQTLGDNGGNRHVNERGYWLLDACKDPGLTTASSCESNEECCGGVASPPTSVCRIDQPLGTPADVVWIEDDIPTGATPQATSDSWNWLPQSPSAAFGTAAHQDNLSSGMHQHYFTGATTTMPVQTGDKLYTYVYLDPATPPTSVMLQWHSTAQGWNHRAYWGANNIGFGTNGTQTDRLIGALPITAQWIRLELPASAVGLEGLTVDGMAFTLSDGLATFDHSGTQTAGVDTTWFEDSAPAGAVLAGTWSWISNVPSIPFGLRAHKSSLAAGVHQHYFTDASAPLSLATGEKIFTYVWIDPVATPSEIQLQWNSTDLGWSHRAYWGTNNAGWGWGTNGTDSRRYMGPMPPTGQWVRLEIPVEQVGLAGRMVGGMAFTLNDGTAAWDHSGKVPVNTLSKHCTAVTPPICTPVNGGCFADANCCGFPSNKCITGICTPPALPLSYPAATYTRDYTAKCGVGEQLKWHFVDWKTTTPGDSKLVFLAQTGPDTSHLSSQVLVGSASGATITNWTGGDVGALFAGAVPPIVSAETLRVSVQFTPTSDGLQSPTLNAWRATWDCTPVE